MSVSVSFEFLSNKLQALALLRARTKGECERAAAAAAAAPVRNMLLLCGQRNHDVMKRAQTLVDAQCFSSPHTLRTTLGDVF